jgi:membrane fusion protein (multidrug efflux system)
MSAPITHLHTRLIALLKATGCVLTLSVLLSGCPAGNAPAGAPSRSAPPAEVGVVTTAFSSVPLQSELPGRTEAYRLAQVRARVAGIVQKIRFIEGRDVKEDQDLFQIDAAPYKAALVSAQASLAKAEANLAQAQALAERNKPLIDAQAISQQEYLNSVAAFKQAQADVALARAGVTTAQLNVDYAQVRAPITGRIGRPLVTEGALVGQGEATPLAIVQQIDPIYVNFTQSADEVMRLRTALQMGKLHRTPTSKASVVQLVLEDGSSYPLTGQLLFSDLTVDASTGQVTLRAKFPNPKGLLLPGMFVRVKTQQATVTEAVLLPQQAVLRSSESDTVKVVAADGKVSIRRVKVQGSREGQWIILEGLKEGEMVVTEGFQKMKGDAPVKPVPWKPAPTAPQAPAASAAARS